MLPVVVPLAVVTLAGLLWRLRRRGLLSLPRAAVAVALCVYAAGVVANTVFPIYLDKPGTDAHWEDYVDLVPIAGYEAADALMNVAVFVPLGALLALLAPRASWRRALVLVALVSASIEVTQYATAHLLGGGHIADIDDLTFNVVGGALGIGALALLSRTRAAALVDRFRWSPPADERTARARPSAYAG